MKILSKGYVNIGAVEKSIYFFGKVPASGATEWILARTSCCPGGPR
jgi:hypothetical protein